MKTEFGDYYDNLEALYFAQRQIDLGRVREGLKILNDLRNHIQRTQDTKSERYLLENIKFYEMTAAEYGGFRCCETISANPRSFARQLRIMIGRYLRAVLALATRRGRFAKGRSSTAIPQIWF